jgi:hypothetical protein
MYWCKPHPNPSPRERGFFIVVALILFIAGLSSCKPEVKENLGAMKYFDLKGFFRADSARLSSRHPQVTKTVVQNGKSQTKKVYIENWGAEFEMFTSSDINKPAWRDSYSINNSDSVLIYTAKSPDLKTNRIIINKHGDKVKWILIYNHTKNLLYENTERLTYFPDSVYSIAKSQQVRLLGKNLYAIKGVFN